MAAAHVAEGADGDAYGLVLIGEGHRGWWVCEQCGVEGESERATAEDRMGRGEGGRRERCGTRRTGRG